MILDHEGPIQIYEITYITLFHIIQLYVSKVT